MLIGTKVRIYPTEDQAEFLIAQFGAVRFAYNKALHIKSHMYRFHNVSLSPKHDLKPLLSTAKKSRKYPWLSNYDSVALQQSVINLHKAFDNFFNPKIKAKYPKFKRRNGPQSSYHCGKIKVLDGAIKVPKIGPIKAKLHRVIQGTLKSITVSLSATGKFYASILVDTGLSPPSPVQLIDASTGIDLGLSHFAIQSNGSKVANPRFIKRSESNLKRKQRKLARKKKGSANRTKARLIVAKCHERIKDCRADFQHKLSRTIVDENQAVIVETLKPTNMMKNKRLSKHIADAAWNSFVKKLEYKAKEKGHHVIKVDQWFPSSKTCHCCGSIAEKMPLNVRRWRCEVCLSTHDRDINAAINIHERGLLELKAAGLAVSACGGLRNSCSSQVVA